jgi:hypothetical protein
MGLASLVYRWAVMLAGVPVGQALMGHHVQLASAIGGSLLLTAGAMLGYLRRQGQASAHQPPGTDPTTTSTEPEYGQIATVAPGGELDTTGLLGPGHWRAISRGQPRYRRATPDRHDLAAGE